MCRRLRNPDTYFSLRFCNPDAGSKSNLHYCPQGPLGLGHPEQPIILALRTLLMGHPRGHLRYQSHAFNLSSP